MPNYISTVASSGAVVDQLLTKITQMPEAKSVSDFISTQNVTNDSLNGSITSLQQAEAALETDFTTHKDTDLVRWQDYYNLKAEFYDLKASVQNKTLDTSSTVDIESAAQGGGYTVVSSLGGRVNFSAIIILLTIVPQWIAVNGVKVWQGNGLGLGEISDAVEVEDGDIVTCSGMTEITFAPYKAS